MRWTIRLARLSDLDRVDDLEEVYYGADRMTRRQLRYHIKNKRAQFLVVAHPQSDETMGAILTLFNRRGFARIYSVVLDKDLRGQGLAKKLIRAAFKETRQRGMGYVTLEVKRTNKIAIGLYKKMGFEQIGILRDYYKKNVDGIKMIKHL